jgi:hypothetical protein
VDDTGDIKIVVLSVFVSMRVVCGVFGGQSSATEVVNWTRLLARTRLERWISLASRLTV